MTNSLENLMALLERYQSRPAGPFDHLIHAKTIWYASSEAATQGMLLLVPEWKRDCDDAILGPEYLVFHPDDVEPMRKVFQVLLPQADFRHIREYHEERQRSRNEAEAKDTP